MGNNEKASQQSQNKQVIICDNCGDENIPGVSYCVSCGVKLEGTVIEISESEKKDTVITEDTSSKNTVEQKSDKKKGKKQSKKIEEKKKNFSAVRLFYLILVLVIIGLVNLFIAGVFDSPSAVTINQNTEFDKIHSGVDLEQERKIKDLSEKVKANPNDWVSLLSLAHLLNDSGQEAEAIEKYNAYLKLDPQKPDVIVDLGVCYFDLKEYDKAKEYMLEAVKIEPKHQIAHFNMGIINSAANNITEAKKWWQKVIDIDPNTKIAQKAQEFINSN